MATCPPPAKREKKPSATAASLADDVLLEIFIRLPSLATLVRAAHTCRAWRRAAASSRDFRRRFREAHPAAPLLGLFFDPPGGGAVQTPAALPVFPSFVPARGADDGDRAAAVRGGDFFLTSLQERPGGWHIHDCRGGYILVGSSDLKAMAVLNPLARRSERFFDSGHGHHEDNNLQDQGGNHGFQVARLCCPEPEVALDARLLCSEEDPKSFRVVILAHDHDKQSRVRATVFSSDTGDWSVRPWVDVLPIHVPPHSKLRLLNSNMQADGMLYWAYNNLRHMLTLDTATMDFSVTELPLRVNVNDRECSFAVGETSDGTPCLVYAFKFRVSLFLLRTDDDGVRRWLRDKITPIDAQLDGVLGQLKNKYSHVQVVAVRDGFAYLATSIRYHHATTPSWVLSLCLETMKLDKLFQRPYECCVHPYVMSWPPSLIS